MHIIQNSFRYLSKIKLYKYEILVHYSNILLHNLNRRYLVIYIVIIRYLDS